MKIFNNNNISLNYDFIVYYIASIYSNLPSVEEIILREYPDNKLILYIKVKDNYINKLGYLIDEEISYEEELFIDNIINTFNQNSNIKLILSSNINSQKHFGTFNNIYNNISPMNESILYGKKNIRKKIK